MNNTRILFCPCCNKHRLLVNFGTNHIHCREVEKEELTALLLAGRTALEQVCSDCIGSPKAKEITKVLGEKAVKEFLGDLNATLEDY
jgi:hypothetical protein